MTERQQVTIYTDGACDPNPGPGGWAALLIYTSQEVILSGSEPDTTNNRMELTAAIQALGGLKESSQVDFYTDSQYLKMGITEWIPNWKARNWRRKGGKLANVDLWQALDKAIQAHEINWHWVKGHAGDRNNQRVDYLARQSIQSN
ncbi:MAG: ribonuclease HI [Chloroflexota bacterium]|nr:MAG: ribonuclease HI [Chloroflexota bacterium]